MGVLTTLLKLLKPGENDYYNQQTEQADNWQKVDDYAVYTDRDKNAIWGGLDGGGLIEDPSVTKVVGKRYIGTDGKAYVCLIPSNVNTSDNYMPCNVYDNTNKIKTLLVEKKITNTFNQAVAGVLSAEFVITAIRVGNTVNLNFYMTPLGIGGDPSKTENLNFVLPTEFKPKQRVWGIIRSDNPTVPIRPFGIVESGIITFGFYGPGLVVGSGLGGSISYIV